MTSHSTDAFLSANFDTSGVRAALDRMASQLAPLQAESLRPLTEALQRFTALQTEALRPLVESVARSRPQNAEALRPLTEGVERALAQNVEALRSLTEAVAWRQAQNAEALRPLTDAAERLATLHGDALRPLAESMDRMTRALDDSPAVADLVAEWSERTVPPIAEVLSGAVSEDPAASVVPGAAGSVVPADGAHSIGDALRGLATSQDLTAADLGRLSLAIWVVSDVIQRVGIEPLGLEEEHLYQHLLWALAVAAALVMIWSTRDRADGS